MMVRLEPDPLVPLGQVRGDVVVPTFTELEAVPSAATSPLPVIKNGAALVHITLPDGEVARDPPQLVVSIGRGAENDVIGHSRPAGKPTTCGAASRRRAYARISKVPMVRGSAVSGYGPRP